METIVLEYEDSFFNQEIFDFSEDDKKFPKSFQCEDWKSEKCEMSLMEIENIYNSNISSQQGQKIINFIQKKLEGYIFFNPFQKIMDRYSELYRKIFNCKPLPPSISKFIPEAKPIVSSFLSQLEQSETFAKNFEIPLTLKKENYINLLNEIFAINFGRIPHLENILIWFPDYLLKFHQTYQMLMFGEGPLPMNWRFFLAIMAVSCYNCDYLLNRLMINFIKTGGNIKWLENGLKDCPKKLQKIANLNLIIAHSPWKIRNSAFSSENLKGELYWSKNEMVQAVIILAFHHSLSCLCVSNGILQEEEYRFLFKLPNNKILESACENETPDISSIKKQTKEQEKKVLDYLKNYSSDNEKEDNKDSDQEHCPIKQESKPHDPSKKRKKKKSGNDSYLESGLETSFEITKNNEFSEYFEKFLVVEKNASRIKFVNFEWHEYKGLKSYDLTWENVAYSFISEYFPDLAQLINDKFKYIKKMTNAEFVGHHVDTDPFRKAIWNYSENIYGYVYSDYDYGKINKCIPRPYKEFIKKIITDPISINSKTFRDIPLDFKPFEYTQSSLLVIEAKFEITLIYLMSWLQD